MCLVAWVRCLGRTPGALDPLPWGEILGKGVSLQEAAYALTALVSELAEVCQTTI